MGGGYLPLGVADQGPWLDPALAPEPCQGDHHRKEGGLDDVEAIKPGCVLFSQDLSQGPVHMGGQCCFALLHVLGEGR